MIASGWILAIAALTASASSAFTTTPSTPFSRSSLIPASLLVIAITSCLAATSAATNGLPMAPLAPATNTFISCNLLLNNNRHLSQNCWQNVIQSRHVRVVFPPSNVVKPHEAQRSGQLRLCSPLVTIVVERPAQG